MADNSQTIGRPMVLAGLGLTPDAIGQLRVTGDLQRSAALAIGQSGQVLRPVQVDHGGHLLPHVPVVTDWRSRGSVNALLNGATAPYVLTPGRLAHWLDLYVIGDGPVIVTLGEESDSWVVSPRLVTYDATNAIYFQTWGYAGTYDKLQIDIYGSTTYADMFVSWASLYD